MAGIGFKVVSRMINPGFGAGAFAFMTGSSEG
jgi:hypothetical protein